MSLRTLERDAPSLFKNRIPAKVRVVLFSICAIALMMADARLKLTEPVRQVVSAVLYPLQWGVMQPVDWLTNAKSYFQDLKQAQAQASEAHRVMAGLSLKAHDVQQLQAENLHLRELLGLRSRLEVSAIASEVMYETPDSYTRRVVLDKGQAAGVEPGSPVLDDLGVLGQVTRVQPFSSEVTLLSDPDQAIPVVVARTGVRAVIYGDASNLRMDGMELRFMPHDADVQEGDELVTSGVDGVYVGGWPVARVVAVERRSQSPFLRIVCEPFARMNGAKHVMVLKPLNLLKSQEAPEVEPLVSTQSEAFHQREEISAQRRAPSSVAMPGEGDSP